MVDLTVEEARALRAVVMGDHFDVKAIDSALEKLEGFIEESDG